MSDYTIRQSNNYSSFNTVLGNRTVRPAHVKKIRTAIEKDPESIKYNPILVNEFMEVIDGQHRKSAIEQLGLPIYYVMVEGLQLQDVQKLNSVAKQWQPIDYAEAFKQLGNENYAMYVEVKRDPDLALNHDSLMRYLALDNPITSQSFNEGRLKVDNYYASVELLMRLREMGEYYQRYNIRSFALAYLRLARDERYDHNRMIKQMKLYGDQIEDYSKETDYFKALNRVYNFNKAKSNKVFFGDIEYLQQ